MFYLDIERPQKARGLFRRDKIISERTARFGVALDKFTYVCKSGKVNLARLNRFFGNAEVLIPESLDLSDNTTFRRFYSNAFSKRLCVNMALELLRRAGRPENLRLGLYDPDGEAPDFFLESLKYCRQPVAVTCGFLPYRHVSRRALYELGASAIITRSTDELKNCDLIVAPTEVLIPLPIKSSAIVLTAGEPRVSLSGRVYPRYTLSLPSELEGFKPDALSAEYFCSALYTLCRLYPLGSITPLSCVNGADSQTVDSLINLLDIANKKAYNS